VIVTFDLDPFPAEYALASKISHPRNVYLRQDAFGAQVNSWLATAFAPARLSSTIDQIMAGQQAHADRPAAQAAVARIEEASIKMGRYRAALDAGGDPGEIGKWISDTKAQRLAAEAELRQATATRDTLTRQQVQALIEVCADVARDLCVAEVGEVAQAYQKLGLRLTYHPWRNLVQATAGPRPANLGKWKVSEGGLEPPCPFGALAPQRTD
jgi:site-specific DNA recombinase